MKVSNNEILNEIKEIQNSLKGGLDYARIAEEILKVFDINFPEEGSLSKNVIKRDVMKMIAKRELSEEIVSFLERIEYLIEIDR